MLQVIPTHGGGGGSRLSPFHKDKEKGMDTNLTPYALGSEDGEARWFFGTLAIFKATAEQTGGRFALVE